MRKISIRQFQQNMYKEIENLPFSVTRLGKVIFTVFATDIKPEPVKIEHIVKASIPVAKQTTCKHGCFLGVGNCKHGCH